MSTFRSRCASEMAAVAAGKRPTGFTAACSKGRGVQGLGAEVSKPRVGRSIWATAKSVGREGLWAARRAAHKVGSKASAWSERRAASRKAAGVSSLGAVHPESACKVALRNELAHAGSRQAKGKALARYMAKVRAGTCGR